MQSSWGCPPRRLLAAAAAVVAAVGMLVVAAVGMLVAAAVGMLSPVVLAAPCAEHVEEGALEEEPPSGRKEPVALYRHSVAHLALQAESHQACPLEGPAARNHPKPPGEARYVLVAVEMD